MNQIARTARVEVRVDASPEQVWDVLADITRIGEWSRECHRARWSRGPRRATAGARFSGSNKVGAIRWRRSCLILVAEQPRELRWRTLASPLFPDSTEWVVRLDPDGAGTRITQSYQVLKLHPLLARLFAVAIPTHVDRDEALRAELRGLGEVAGAAPPRSAAR